MTNITTTTTTTWDPNHFLCPNSSPSTLHSPSYTLLILNQPIPNPTFFHHLWTHSTLQVCADGGANRLFDTFHHDESALRTYTPRAICGDLDSLRNDVRQVYEALGVRIVKSEDQDSTDFDKCLKFIGEAVAGDGAGSGSGDGGGDGNGIESTVFVYNCLGGRLDHAFHSIHQLYQNATSNHKIYLISEENLTFLLPLGRNEIKLPHSSYGPACGILPVGGKSVITTRGLQWDVENWETMFGGNVSTSNYLKSQDVVVDTIEKVVFTVEVKVGGIVGR